MSLAYVESSAIVKLAWQEVESHALREALDQVESRVASELAVVEVVRAAGRIDGDAGRTRGRAALLRAVLVPIDRGVLDVAASLDPKGLRSLDAIHVATALALESPDVVFFSYDRRTIEAAEANGLTVASPGA